MLLMGNAVFIIITQIFIDKSPIFWNTGLHDYR